MATLQEENQRQQGGDRLSQTSCLLSPHSEVRQFYRDRLENAVCPGGGDGGGEGSAQGAAEG